MVVAHLPPGVPIYAIWFGTSGALATLSGLLAGRDGAFRKASEKEFEKTLAKLNDFLSRYARVAQTIWFNDAVVYVTIRDKEDYEELRAHVNRVRPAMVWADAMVRLTRGCVLAVVLHFAAGVTVTALSLGGVLGQDASDPAILAPWVVCTSFVASILLTKAIILQARGDGS